jgi:hypothetical protein
MLYVVLYNKMITGAIGFAAWASRLLYSWASHT